MWRHHDSRGARCARSPHSKLARARQFTFGRVVMTGWWTADRRAITNVRSCPTSARAGSISSTVSSSATATPRTLAARVCSWMIFVRYGLPTRQQATCPRRGEGFMHDSPERELESAISCAGIASHSARRPTCTCYFRLQELSVQRRTTRRSCAVSKQPEPVSCSWQMPGSPPERWLLQHDDDLRSDILVSGWHSGDISGTPDFLAQVRPAVAISSPLPFGSRPERHAEWENALQSLGARCFDQSACGAVKIVIRKNGETEVQSFLETHTLRSRAR